MTDATEHDRLVELLADRLVGDPYRPARLSAPDAEEIADVLIANGWSRKVQRPEVDAEVEWGVQANVSGVVLSFAYEEQARELVDHGEGVSTLVSRTVGPWQEAQ